MTGIKQQAVSDATARAIVNRNRPPDAVKMSGMEFMPVEGAVAAVREALAMKAASHPLEQQQAVSGDVVERMAKAIFFRGLPVDESIWQLLDPLTIKAYRQQAQAALTASGVGRMRERIAEQVSEGDGHWRACTGCQERVDGCVSSKDYPFDPIFQCHPGGGCGECGGIGVVWDNIDYADFARTALQDNGENNGSD